MTAAQTDTDGPDDGSLMEAVRNGSTHAYGQLYERHVSAARNMARQVANSSAEADDLVSEAFAKVLQALQSGNGPTSAFRAYLLTSLRHTAYDRSRRDRKLHLSEDVTSEAGADVSVPFVDPAVDGLERTLAARAFATLPQRWQTVLWHIEIEGQGPGDVAPILGLSANGVSALAYRAREGLRQAYLQVHLGDLDEADHGVDKCRATATRLGAWTRRGLSKRETAQVDSHLDSCDRCRALAAELAEVNGGLRVVVAPLVLGTAAVGYLSTTPGGGAAAGAAATAGSSAAGAAGAADAASSLPRQLATTAASVGALGLAVALGLLAGGDQQAPVAASPPPSNPPVVHPDEPSPPPAPVPAPPAEPAPPQQPSPPAAPAPPPAKPSLEATGPGAPIQLVAGGAPARMPIEIRNSGEAPSRPITTKITLPAGVTATLPASTEPASTGPASTGPAWTTPRTARALPAATTPQAAPATPQVRCERSQGVLTCTTERGLRPGESITLGFLIRASEQASDGDISVRIVNSHASIPISRVHVTVRPPAPQPGVTLDARAASWQQLPWLGGRVDLETTNTGSVPGSAQVTLQLPDDVRAHEIDEDCRRSGRTIRCREHLRPGETFHASVWVGEPVCAHDRCDWIPSPHRGEPRPLPGHDIELSAKARLGTATDQETVILHSWWSPGWPLPGDEWSDDEQPGDEQPGDEQPGSEGPGEDESDGESSTPSDTDPTPAPTPSAPSGESEHPTRPDEQSPPAPPSQPDAVPTRSTSPTSPPDTSTSPAPVLPPVNRWDWDERWPGGHPNKGHSYERDDAGD